MIKIPLYTTSLLAYSLLFIICTTAQAGYQEPKILKISKHYPVAGSRQLKEGWVVIHTMIDEHGNPFESSIIQSGGSPLFKKFALKINDKATFQPAHFNGKPIESSFTYKYTYMIKGGTDGASTKFVFHYKKLRRAIKQGNHQKAELAINKLRNMTLNNFYEAAYMGIANFVYYETYGGTTEDKLDALESAIAFEESAKYLPQSLFNIALQNLYLLQIKNSAFGHSLKTYALLNDNADNENFIEHIQSTHEKILTLRDNDEPFKMKAKITQDGRWKTRLLKKGVTLSDLTGEVESLKLYCNKKFRGFTYKTDTQYEIPESWGDCDLVLIGTPQTELSLIQF